MSLGVGCGDMRLSPGLASGAAQYPQNIVPSGFSLPHCLHAGIRSPWPHAKFLRNQRTSPWQLSPARLLPWSNHFSCAPKPATLQTCKLQPGNAKSIWMTKIHFAPDLMLPLFRRARSLIRWTPQAHAVLRSGFGLADRDRGAVRRWDRISFGGAVFQCSKRVLCLRRFGELNFDKRAFPACA